MAGLKKDDYTLLIVESPSVAQIIDTLQIPALQVWSSKGYCWRPHYNPKSGRLEKRVNPDQIKDRTELKSLARWTNNIIVATDTDPSGVFLAEAVRSYLKQHSIKRGYLSSLTAEGVARTIRNAEPMLPDDYRRLERRMKVRRILNRQNELRWIKLSTLALFRKSSYPLRYVDDKGRCWHLISDDNNSLNSRTVSNPEQWHPEPAPPPTTLCLLNTARKSQETFSFAQDNLNHTFTACATAGFPISYPRTSARGWFTATWNYLTNRMQKEKRVEHLLPAALRTVCPDTYPHDALYVLHPSGHTPGEVRPELRRDHYLIYKKLYHLTRQALASIPNILPEPETSMNPVITTSGWCHFLDNCFACSPSSIGKVTDQLTEEDFIHLPTGSDQIQPGGNFEKMASATDLPLTSELITTLTQLIRSDEVNDRELADCAIELRNCCKI